MRKVPLPEREKQICRRLKIIRKQLGLSEEAAASRVGIARERWHNYERLRTPLRCDLALRICRQLIISEEWLATGSFKLIEEAASKAGIGSDASLHQFYIRSLVDLQAEPEYLHVPPGQLFSEAFRTILSAKYALLVQRFFHAPRIVFRDSDDDTLLIEYLSVLNQRWLKLLRNEALRVSGDSALACRTFLRGQFEFGTVFFKRMMGWSTPEITQSQFDFLRAIATDPTCPVGPLHTRAPAVVAVQSRKKREAVRPA
jgi:transcriptional regulator with XRE-family HTH domain